MLENVILSPGQLEREPEAPEAAIQVIESGDTYGKIAVEPVPKGYGVTIGNPLRRILLSSIKGSAITWVRIDDVVHEYAAIPGVKEEVMDLLLNIKRIRINSLAERTGKMRLEVTGQGPVCAGDIITSSDFQIVNPELHLATLDSDDASLSIEFNVDSGIGYRTKDPDNMSGYQVGMLPLDAVFSPVRKVNFNVEPFRWGQSINSYERLVLEIWTDGTITPLEAARQAGDDLVEHFFRFKNLDRGADLGIARSQVDVAPEVYQTPIESLELSPRTLNCLKRSHIARVGQVLEMSEDDLLKIRNFGDKSLEELQEKLAERGISGYPRTSGRQFTGELGSTVVGLAGLAEAWNDDSPSDDLDEVKDDDVDGGDEEDTV